MKKIYKITLVNYKAYYCIAEDPTIAEKLVLKFLNEEDLYFSRERKVKTIETIGNMVNDLMPIYKELYNEI